MEGERYRYAIRIMTTTSMEPEGISCARMRSVAKSSARWFMVAHHEGFTDLKTFNEHIRVDRKNYAVSGQQLLELYQHYADQMYTKLPQLFGQNCRGISWLWNGLEPYRELMRCRRITRSVPAMALSRRINVNEYSPQTRLLLNVEAIAYHEGVPGHHLQVSIANELTEFAGLSKIRCQLQRVLRGLGLLFRTAGEEVGLLPGPVQRIRAPGK